MACLTVPPYAVPINGARLMDLEFQQLEYRYETLRKQDPSKERRLLASLSERGQVCPVVVLPGLQDGHFVLLDGYKRVRGLKRLRMDTVHAVLWDLEEVDALLLERLLRTAESDGPLEQGWLLSDLRDRFGMSLGELGRRFGRTPGWVSRRLALVRDLPEAVHAQVRRGRISAHTAMKVLVPLARANKAGCLQFLEALLRAEFSTREAETLQAAWLKGNPEVRARLTADPALFLRARAAAKIPDPPGKTHLALLFDDLGLLAAVARRGTGRIQEGALGALLPKEALEAGKAMAQAQSDCQNLFTHVEKELPCAQ